MIKNWEYLPQYQEERQQILDVVDSVFSSGSLILGKQVESFEKNFSKFAHCKFGVGVNSGTDALLLCLKAFDVGFGDEVITVSNTAIPTVSAIGALGAKARFVDVNPQNFLMNVDLIEQQITPKTKAIICVHLYGQMVDMDRVLEIGKKYHLRVIEDCAQAHGALYKSKIAGSLGELSAFSFYPTKILGAYGDGGLISGNDPLLETKLRKLRFYGISSNYFSEIEGYNTRLDEVQAAILNYKLHKIDKELHKRRQIAQIYNQEFSKIKGFEIPFVDVHNVHAFHLYTIKVRNRNEYVQFMKQNDVEIRIMYPTPVHLMTAYKHLGFEKGSLPVTEALSSQICSLPLHAFLSESDIDKIVSLSHDFSSKNP